MRIYSIYILLWKLMRILIGELSYKTCLVQASEQLDKCETLIMNYLGTTRLPVNPVLKNISTQVDIGTETETLRIIGLKL